MQEYEAELFLSHLDLRERSAWEQTRQLCYITAQVNSRKRLSPSDLMHFPWDNESSHGEESEEENEEEMADIEERMKQIMDYKNGRLSNETPVEE